MTPNPLTGDLVAGHQEIIDRANNYLEPFADSSEYGTGFRGGLEAAKEISEQALANHDPALVDKVMAVTRAARDEVKLAHPSFDLLTDVVNAITPEEWEKLL